MLYAQPLTEGKRTGEGGSLSAQSVRNVHITIQGTLADAERKGTGVRNVADHADGPTTSRTIDLTPTPSTSCGCTGAANSKTAWPPAAVTKGGYVFAKPDGSPIHPDLISQTFERLLAKIDLPRIRLHDLRHTHATILLQQGVNPKVVSEHLGHASVSFTMDVYQHVLPGMQAQAAATLRTTILWQHLNHAHRCRSPQGTPPASSLR